ncbi:helix-turn-helix transcriptional regulator [Haloechinothrix sp. YIM 98757]|uniref:Helix-turn-helix transcriptional regulator n=1 Tax=Haloechinothrix aidingensis TaxID=2752311 RepID=A0A838ADM9_9PSEU|nr:helix-turn-helix transcriptional regulator [Haloechinothrix aidingensis]MBA0127265.1 helix-turn-helix transcriptional regulator [Haloechinothrix aidingensis]
MDASLTPDSESFRVHLCDLLRLLNRYWAPHILTALVSGPMRYTDLLHALQATTGPDAWTGRPSRRITDKVLRETLEAMHEEGLLQRQCTPDSTMPPRFALTTTAAELLDALRPAVSWVVARPDAIAHAQQQRQQREASSPW